MKYLKKNLFKNSFQFKNKMKIYSFIILFLYIPPAFFMEVAIENDPIQIKLLNGTIQNYVFHFSPDAFHFPVLLTFDPISEYFDPGILQVYLSNHYDDLNASHYELKCSVHSFFGCIFEFSEKENMVELIYFNLECLSENCSYKMRVTHTKEIQLSFNHTERFKFRRTNSEMFNLTIPAQDQFSRIILEIKYKTFFFQEKIFEEHHEVRLSNGKPKIYKFNDQQVLILQSQDSELCYNCNITALILCPINSTIEINMFLYHKTLNSLILNKFYIDYIFFSVNNEYFIKLDDEIVQSANFSLTINFNSLSGGRKKLYFDVDKDPASFELYRWNSTFSNSFYQESDIHISREDLNQLKLQGSTYYFLVKAETQGIFSFFLTQNNNKILPLYLGSTQSGLISKDEIVNYEIQLWGNEDSLEELTISATVMSGHLNFYGRKCGALKNCQPITKEDIENKSNFNFKSESEGVSSLTFLNDCELTYCYYIFAIIGKSFTYSNLTKYDLILKKNNTFISLIENVCFESRINYNDYEKFKMYVEPNNDEIIAVNFFINSDLQFFVSKDQICANENDNSCIKKKGNLLNSVFFELEEFEPKIPLNGTYFIFVLGLKSSEFVLFPEVLRKNYKKAFIQLLEGKTLKYFLSLSKKTAFFEFLVDSNEETNIEINVQSNDFNNLFIYVQKDGSVPNGNNYFISSLNNHLSFTHNSFDRLIYRVAIESKYYLSSYRNNKIDFSIMYSTGKTLQHLDSNHPFYDTIKPKTKKNFLYYFDLNNAVIYATYHIINSMDLENMFVMSFSMFMQKSLSPLYETNDSTIKLDQIKLKSLCKSRYSDYVNFKENCPIYISIKNDNSHEVQYVLNIRTIDYAIQVRSDKEQILKMNEEETYNYLYFLPSSLSETLELYTYSLSFDFDLYISIYNNNQTLPVSYWVYPNETVHHIKYLDKKRVSMKFKNQEFISCWPNCAILFKIIEKNKKNTGSHPEKLLHFMITCDFSEIFENKAIHFNSEFHNLKFFFYDLKYAFETKFSLLIDLTNYVGRGEIYLIVNEGNTEMFPSADVYDFFSIDGHLTISFEELLSKVQQNSNVTIAKTLLIGVFCMNPLCESSLNVRLSNYLIRKILHGHPYEFYLSNKTIQVFEYYHYEDKSFRIKLNKEFGKGVFAFVPCFNKSIKDCILDKKFKMHYHAVGTDALLVSKDDSKNYCFECFYKIVLLDHNLKGTLQIILENEYLILADGHFYFDEVVENNENKYICKAPKTEELEIILNVFANELELYVSRKKGSIRSQFEYKVIKQNGPIISLVLDPEISNSNNNEEVFIIVYGKTESKYSIKCRFKSSYNVLHAGLMEFSHLEPLLSHKYVFHSNEEEIYQNNPRLAIYYEDSHSETLEIKLFVKDLNTQYGNAPISKSLFLDKNQTIYTFHSLTFNLLNRSALYEILISNLIHKKVNYSISIETNNVNILPYDVFLNFALLPRKWNYYEAFIPNKGLFTLNLLECLGNVEIYTTDSYEKLLKNEFSNEFKTFSGQDNLKIFKVEKGKFFFALFNSENIQTFTNYIQINTHLYDSYLDIPQYRLMIANDGILDWIENQNEKITIVFPNVYCKIDCDSNFLDTISIDYKILVSKSMNFLNSHGKCGVISFQEIKIDDSTFFSKELISQKLLNASENINFVLNDMDLNNNYYVTIVSKINGFDKDLPVFMYYKEIEIKKTEIRVERIYTYGSILICLIVISLLSFCGCYYCSSYWKIKNTLKYEIKEVENVSSITSLNTSIEMKSSRFYQGLVEQVN